MPTFAEYIASGSGGVEFSMYIEGCPVAFVTSEAMEGADSQGIVRVGGLKRSGLSVAESVDMPNAVLSYSLGSATIEDTSARAPSTPWLRGASSVFSAVPRVVGYLTSSVTAAAGTWPVRDASVFTVGAIYHCDSEAVEVTARDLGANTIDVSRAKLRTSVQAHYVEVPSTSGSVTAVCPIMSAPIYRNRRVWIYGHGADEVDALSDGVAVARGMLGSNPKMQGQSWQLSIQPRTQALEQEVGSVTEELKPRGIYYAGTSGLMISIDRKTGANASDAYADNATIRVFGFWESQEAFCRAVTAAISSNATVVSWGSHSFDARPIAGGWALYITCITARFVVVRIQSGVDGFQNSGDVYYVDSRGNVSAVPAVTVSTGNTLTTRTGTCDAPGAATIPGGAGFLSGGGYPYATGPEGLRSVPRVSAHSGGFGEDAATIATFPKNRLYLESVLGISVGDYLSVHESRGDGVSYDAKVTVVDAGNRYIEIEDPDDGVTFDVGRGVTFQIVPTTNELTLKLVQNFGTATHLGGLITALIVAAQNGANAGRAPFLTSDDFASTFDIADTAIAAAAGRSWLLSRNYRFSSRVKLSDIIKHEARLYGLFMCTDIDGRIQFRPVTTRTQADFIVSAGDVILAEAPKLDMSDAIITGANISQLYDPQEDKWKGRNVEITSVGATAMLRAHRPLEVKPYSNPTGTAPADFDLYLQVNPTIQLFSSSRAIVTFQVPVMYAQRVCGDSCLLSIEQVPYDGQRSYDGGSGGLVAVRGTLVGRKWSLNEPCVTLTVMCDALDVAGYAPTARISTQSGAGTVWTLTTETAHYGDGVTMDADSFAVGMRIRIVEWDAATPTERTGIVTGQSYEDIEVTLDASWTPGASVWNVIFQPTDATGITDAQKRYAAIADSTGAIVYSGGATTAARLFAP